MSILASQLSCISVYIVHNIGGRLGKRKLEFGRLLGRQMFAPWAPAGTIGSLPSNSRFGESRAPLGMMRFGKY